MASQLHSVSIDNSKATGYPVVLLHGFGGLANQWRGLQTTLSFKAPTIAFDLPGHGKSVDFPNAGPPITAAKAVVAELDNLEIEKAHFVGHSMGGAISSLIGLIAPERVASLTLLAPGGYGTEVNVPLLHQWASASSKKELAEVLPQFFGEAYQLDDKVIDFQHAARSQPGAVEKLKEIAGGMFEGGKQGMLPVQDLLANNLPISVIWGDADKVLPVQQGQALENKVDLHILEGIGHSPAEEAPNLVKQVVFEKLSG